MGNAYDIALCPECKKPIVLDADDTVMVHRAEGVQKALELLKDADSVEVIRDYFCAFCGNFVEEGNPLENCKCSSAEDWRKERGPVITTISAKVQVRKR